MWNLQMQSPRIQTANTIYWKKFMYKWNRAIQTCIVQGLSVFTRATQCSVLSEVWLCYHGRSPACASLKQVLTIWDNVSFSLSVPFTWNALTHWLCHSWVTRPGIGHFPICFLISKMCVGPDDVLVHSLLQSLLFWALVWRDWLQSDYKVKAIPPPHQLLYS